MTREEAAKNLKKLKSFHKWSERYGGSIELAIEALEQDTAPFDFELYQAGLMDMPQEMIELLNKIRAEIEALPRELPTDARNMVRRTRVLDIIDKYKAESEDKE